MNAEELTSLQAPLKERYRQQPQTALITLRAEGRLGEGVTCKIETGKAPVEAALGIRLRDATVRAEGDLDFRGTLGVSRDVPVGFRQIRLQFDLDTDASEEQLATLLRLTERYCVVYQTLSRPAKIDVEYRLASGSVAPTPSYPMPTYMD